MKIAVIGWRPWSIERRYRSLLLNAPKQGHQVIGFAANYMGKYLQMNLTAFKELGIEVYPNTQWLKRANEWDPDVVFGEYYQMCALERQAQDWANEHGKVGFFLRHIAYWAGPHARFGVKPEWSRTHFLCGSEEIADMTTRYYGGENAKHNWPKERVHVLGEPGLDFLAEPIDVAQIRVRLGVEPGQLLVGLFPPDAPNADAEELFSLAKAAQAGGWKLVVHLHTIERTRQNYDTPLGFYSGEKAASLWSKLQELGAQFIAGCCPGTICGVKFYQCRGLELMAAADALVGSGDPFFEACALSKRYTLLNYETIAELKGSDFYREGHPAFPAFKEMLDPEFEKQDSVVKVSQMIESGSSAVELTPEFIERWFYKLDGLWWQRALNLAEELRRTQ